MVSQKSGFANAPGESRLIERDSAAYEDSSLTTVNDSEPKNTGILTTKPAEFFAVTFTTSLTPDLVRLAQNKGFAK